MNRYLRNFFFMTLIRASCDVASRERRRKHLNRYHSLARSRKQGERGSP